MRPRTLLLAALALVLAALAWRDAAAAYWLKAAPGSAPAGLASDPRIALAARDPMLLFGAASRSDALAVLEEARAALRPAPLEAAAMAQLGLASTLLGNRQLKRKLHFAERISRRDRVTQAALVSLAATEGDYQATFDHLDKLLTVNPGAGTEIFASLAPLVADAKVREVLVRYAQRPWFSAFLYVVADNAANPADLAALMLGARALPPEHRSTLLPRVLHRLVDAGDHDLARQIAVKLGRADPAALDDFSFTAVSTDAALVPLSWQLRSDNIVQTHIAVDDGLEVGVTPGQPAVIAERVTDLSAGTYSLEQEVGGADTGQAPHLEWNLACKSGSDARIVWRQPIPLREKLIRYRSMLHLPGGCAQQLWQLKVLASDRQTTARFRVKTAKLRRLDQRKGQLRTEER
jgi:hypothetical protein